MRKNIRSYYTYIEPVITDPLIRGYFSLAASFFLISILLVFALSPTINTIVRLRKTMAEYREVLGALEQKIAALVAAREKYQKFKAEIPVLLSALPDTVSAETVIGEVVDTATASGVAITGLSFGNFPLSMELAATAAPPERFGAGGKKDTRDVFSLGMPTIGFNLTVSGQGQAIHNYLARLENLPRIIRITSLTMGKTDGGEEAANIDGMAYFKKDSDEK